MIVFLCAHVRISIWTYILTSIVIYLRYRLTSNRRCFLFMLVNWSAEKHQRFLFNVYNFFFYFSHVFYVFNVFIIFFWNVFYIYGGERTPSNY